MQNFIIITCGILMLSITAKAETSTTTSCANGAGTLIQGHNKTDYCLSHNSMNWWTALGWCQTIGKKMIHYPTDCSCSGDHCPTTMSNCPNLSQISSHIAWVSTPYPDGNAAYIELATGKLTTGRRRNDTYGRSTRALCK